MQTTVEFTSIYVGDGSEHVRTKTLDVPQVPDVDDVDSREEWAEEHLCPETGVGIEEGDAGYFAEVVACAGQPSLVGAEFEWGV
ncbi:MAG: hypothetical protein L0H59_08885 [Tomitella sp.]|nr:hypothetical protein [Tomitella sp.]